MDFSAAGSDFTGLIKPEALSLLKRLGLFFAGRNIEAYLVGGFIRDTLLGRKTADIDIAVAADALRVAPEAAAALGGKYVMLDAENGVGRIVPVSGGNFLSGFALDISTLQGDILQDLARRDFTIDAMAFALNLPGRDLPDGIIDPFNGRKDLAEKVVRAVSEGIFTSDAVRLLRAVRLAAELVFQIDDETQELLRRYSGLISGVAGERVREELLRLLAVPFAAEWLDCLDRLGLLTAIFPELEAMRGVEQPEEHYWDVFQHSLMAVRAAGYIVGQEMWEYADGDITDAVPWSPETAAYFDREVSSGSSRKSILKLAALFHDIRKPETKALVNGKVRFLGHGDEGAVAAAGILERLRFSSREIKLVEKEIKYHMRPTQMSQKGLPTDRAVYRYFRDIGETGIDVLYLSLADHLATRGPALILENWREHTRLVDFVIRRHDEKKNIIQPPKIIDGYDIINRFYLKPGPEVGKVLEAVREAQASGEVTNREEAEAFIGCYLAERHSGKGERE